MPEQTLRRWKHQALVDQGLVDGMNSADSAQLRATNKRITALEKKLQLVTDTSELFDAQAALQFVLPPEYLGRTGQLLVAGQNPNRQVTGKYVAS